MADTLKKTRRNRFGVQALTTLLYNSHFAGFFTGKIYTGSLKNVCLPGLNCYSCPGAIGSCPIGSLQAVAASPAYAVSVAVIGFLMVIGGLVGRLVCGFFCPFGWLEDMLYKLPSPKLSTKKLHILTKLKYAVLVIFVFLLPALMVNVADMGSPAFCKWICPQGVVEAAIPLSFLDEGIRSALGNLFLWKLALLVIIVVLSVIFFRPFCKWVCPLGAIYSLFNSFSAYKLTFTQSKCIGCGKCSAVCKMDVNPTLTPNSPECIRCGECSAVCPTKAITKPSMAAYKGVEI